MLRRTAGRAGGHGRTGPGASGSGHSPDDSLAGLLGGRRGAVDATLPPVGFVAGWLASGESIRFAVAAAIGVATAVALWRLRSGAKPRAVLVGLLAVMVAALIALRTGRPADFFLLQVLANGASALAWAVSIVIRWPLLGVVVGLILGQRGTWRRDPALLRAYSRASWVWTATFVLRLVVFVPLWLGDQVVAPRRCPGGPELAACRRLHCRELGGHPALTAT